MATKLKSLAQVNVNVLPCFCFTVYKIISQTNSLQKSEGNGPGSEKSEWIEVFGLLAQFKDIILSRLFSIVIKLISRCTFVKKSEGSGLIMNKSE